VRIPPSPPPFSDSGKVLQNQAFLEPPAFDGGAPRWSTLHRFVPRLLTFCDLIVAVVFLLALRFEVECRTTRLYRTVGRRSAAGPAEAEGSPARRKIDGQERAKGAVHTDASSTVCPFRETLRETGVQHGVGECQRHSGRRGVCTENLNTGVVVMKSAQDGK
jgi:hypothetical protein